MARPFLSKSKYMSGRQCSKLLWLMCHAAEKIPAPDAATQSRFDQGHLITNLAKNLYPDGIDLSAADFRENLMLTHQRLSERRPLFEASFMANGLYSRLDILNPVGRDEWDIIEVKSAASIKEENYDDVAFQRLCAAKCGLSIRQCHLVYINNRYARRGEIDPRQLFTITDISAEVAEASRGIDERIQSMLAVIASPECPEVPVGVHCQSPYECQVIDCWEALPDNNILCLYYGGKKSFELLNRGIYYLRDIPADFKLNAAQQIQRQCDAQGSCHIEKEAIQAFLRNLADPVHYLDFETVNPAIPLWDGVRPYQQVPFQYSLHVTGIGGQTRHYSFLAEGTCDPRPAFLRHLKDTLGSTGSIVTYNQTFEKGIIRDLSPAFPEYQTWLETLPDRIVDLILPFKGFNYYNPRQKGSASLKSVLPALTGQSYSGMPISEGGEASRAYLEMTFGDLNAAQRQQVRDNLEEYCGLDTEAMVRIVAALKEVSD